MTISSFSLDRDLIVEMSRGDRDAQRLFVDRHLSTLTRVCTAVTPAHAVAAALDEMRASESFGALFADYDDEASLGAFAQAVVVNGWLFPRLMRRLGEDAENRADEFEAFFRAPVRRILRRFTEDSQRPLPPGRHNLVTVGEELRRDGFQWVFEQVLRNDRQQLRAFAAAAQSPSYVLYKLRRLVSDFFDSQDAPMERRRRGLPECLETVSAFEKDVFKQYYWSRAGSASAALLALKPAYGDATEDDVLRARTKVEAVLQQHGGAYPALRPILAEPSDEADSAAADAPEEPFEAEQMSAFRGALLQAARNFAPSEVLYLMHLLRGRPSREIAQQMRLPVDDVYALGRRVLNKLRKELASHPAAVNLMATLSEKTAR